MVEMKQGTGKQSAGALEAAGEWLAGVRVAEGRHHRNLTIFPLVREEERVSQVEPETGDAPTWPSTTSGATGNGQRYTLLSDAIENGSARVEEVSEGGEVPFLGIKNNGIRPILIPEGEVLVGAKQNRVVNLTVLVAAQSSFKLPVSCVEQGRWGYVSRHFESRAFAHPKLREKKIRSAQFLRAQTGVAVSDQGEVWDEVDEHLREFAAHSPTRSMTDAYAVSEARMDDYRRSIALPDGACGFLAARGSRIVGLDLFDVPATMAKLWSRMSDAYFIEALRDPEQVSESPKVAAEAFLAHVAARLAPAGKQPELGYEMEVAPSQDADEDMAGSALWYKDAVCHLSAFSAKM